MNSTKLNSQLCVMFSPEVRQQLATVASAEDLPISAVVRRAVKQFLERQAKVANG